MIPDRLLADVADLPHRALFAAFRAYPAQRVIFGFLRERLPIIVVGKTALVFRHEDVLEVMSSDDRFTTARIYAEQFHAFGGPYLLAMDERSAHDSEAAALRSALGTSRIDPPGGGTDRSQGELAALHGAIRREDSERIRDIVCRAAAAQVQAGRTRGQINIPGLARHVTASLMAEYFGVPGPDRQTLIEWAHALFYGTFANLDKNKSVAEAATKANAAFSAYLTGLIARRKAEIAESSPVPDDVLTRLLRLQDTDQPHLDDEGIRRNLQHLCDASDQVAVLATQMVAVILQDFPAVAPVIERAAEMNNRDVLVAAVLEASRFRPMAPLLLRYSQHATVIAAGTSRQKAISRGTQVALVTLSAMFDRRAFPMPGEFRFDRPPDAYLHFGHGIHQCLGMPINLILLPEILRALMTLKDLHVERQIEYDGPVPQQFRARFK